MRHSQPRNRQSHHWSRSQQHWSPSPGDWLQSKAHPWSSRYISPSPSPSNSQHEDKQLHCSFRNLDLQLKWQEFPNREIIRTKQHRITQTCTTEWSTVKSRAQHRNRCSSTLWTTLVRHWNCLLSWLVSYNSQKVPLMGRVMFSIPLLPQPLALWCHKGGRERPVAFHHWWILTQDWHCPIGQVYGYQ